MTRRFSISLDSQLLKLFDTFIKEEGYTNRSEAFRDIIRNKVVKREWEDGNIETAGVAIIVYDHHRMELPRILTDCQHDHHESIISTLHVHLDKHNCLEIIVLKGKAKNIQRIADSLISTKGVKHGRFLSTTTGKNLI